MRHLVLLLLLISSVYALNFNTGSQTSIAQKDISDSLSTVSISLDDQVQIINASVARHYALVRVTNLDGQISTFQNIVLSTSIPTNNVNVYNVVNDIVFEEDVIKSRLDTDASEVENTQSYFVDVQYENLTDRQILPFSSKYFLVSYDSLPFSSGHFNITVEVDDFSGNNHEYFLDPDISACGAIIASGVYTLNQSISESGDFHCIDIQANDTVLDCQGFDMNGSFTSSTSNWGVYVDAYRNFTLMNCHMNGFYRSVRTLNSDQINIINNTIKTSTFGADIRGTTSNLNFSFNHVNDSSLIGSQWLDNVTNITIDNNIFYNNSNNALQIDSSGANISLSNNRINLSGTLSVLTSGIFDNCNSLFLTNNTGPNDLPILFVNNSAGISGTPLDELIICGAVNDVFDNITIAGGQLGRSTTSTPSYQDGILVVKSTNTTFSNSNLSMVNSGLRFLGSNYNDTIVNVSISEARFAIVSSLGSTTLGFTDNLSINNVQLINSLDNLFFSSGLGAFAGMGQININNLNVSFDGTGIYVNNASSSRGFFLAAGSPSIYINNTRISGLSNSIFPFGLSPTSVTSFGNLTIENTNINNISSILRILNTSAAIATGFEISITNLTATNANQSLNFDIDYVRQPGELWNISLASEYPPYSFHQKSLNFINNNASALPLVNTTYHWTDTELGGLTEADIHMYFLAPASSWVLINNSPDTLTNSIFYSFNDTGIYALEHNSTEIGSCSVINTSGNYHLVNNLFNATNPSAPYLDFNCVDIRANDVVLDCQGFNITNNGTGPQNIGILVVGNNITVQNCNVSGYDYQEYSTGDNLQVLNNHFSSSGGAGYASFSANGAQIRNNTFSGLSYGIIHFFGTDSVNVTNNTFSSNLVRDIDADTTSNSFFDLNTFNSGNTGISSSNADNNQYTRNNFTNAGFIALQLVGVDGSNVSGNNFSGNSYSIDMSGGTDNNNIEYNIITSTAFGSPISITGGSSNTIRLNNISGSLQHGIYIDPTSTFSLITSNIIISTLQDGIHSEGNFSTITFNSISNSLNGIRLQGFDSVLLNNVVFSNFVGINVLGADSTTLIADHLYNNGLDLLVNNSAASSIDLNVSQMILDNPSGTLENYSRVSILDLISSGDSYSVSWSNLASPLPSGFISFVNTSINITNYQANDIDSVSFTWTLPEETGYNPGLFRIYRYDGSWSFVSSTLDTSNRIITFVNPINSLYSVIQRNGSIFVYNTTLYYTNQTSYSNYTSTNTSVTVQNTATYLLSYQSGTQSSYFGSTFIFSGFIEIISVVLPVALVLIAVFGAFSYYKNKENK